MCWENLQRFEECFSLWQQAGSETDPNLDVFEDRSMDSAPDGIQLICKLTHEIWMGYNLSSVPIILSLSSASDITFFFSINTFCI